MKINSAEKSSLYGRSKFMDYFKYMKFLDQYDRVFLGWSYSLKDSNQTKDINFYSTELEDLSKLKRRINSLKDRIGENNLGV